jgi:ADP-ribose pyrophosphatase
VTEGGDRASEQAPTGEFTLIGEEERWRGWMLTVGHRWLRTPAGEPFERDVIHHPGAVAVVPLHDDGTVTLVSQYRPAVERYQLEVPAGTLDVSGEEPAAAAQRELGEEVGLQAAHLEHLVTVHNSPGFTDQQTFVFLATGLTPCATGHVGVEEEYLRIERLTLDEAEDRTHDGPFDATTLLGLLLARRALGPEPTPGR